MSRLDASHGVVHGDVHEPALVENAVVAQRTPRVVRQQHVVALHEHDLVRALYFDRVLLRVVDRVVERGDARDVAVAGGASRRRDARHETRGVERERTSPPSDRLVFVREQTVFVRAQVLHVVMKAVHREHHRDVVPRGGVHAVAHQTRERALPRSGRARDADEHARVAVALAEERRRHDARRQLVQDRVLGRALGGPRERHAGKRAGGGQARRASVGARDGSLGNPSPRVALGSPNAAGRNRRAGKRRGRERRHRARCRDVFARAPRGVRASERAAPLRSSSSDRSWRYYKSLRSVITLHTRRRDVFEESDDVAFFGR